MSVIHMAIENAETILFLFQMAILSKVHGRVNMGGLSYYQNARTSEEQSRAKKLRSQSRQMSRKKIRRCRVLRPGHIKLDRRRRLRQQKWHKALGNNKSDGITSQMWNAGLT